MHFGVIYEPCIVGKVEITPSPAVGGIEQVTECMGINLVADSKKNFSLKNFINVTIEFPDRCSSRYEFGREKSDSVHRGRGQVGVDGKHGRAPQENSMLPDTT